MGGYKDTITWRKIYGNAIDNKEECEFLRIEYEKFRDNARLLAGEIASILPEYTVHDITHIDALWDMTDVFLSRDYFLSPIECFVLGGAFILHDLGMLLAAYPEGRKGIQKQNIWKDTVANLCKQRGLSYNFEELDNIDKDVEKIATEKTLRLLHGQKAKELAMISWKDSNEKDMYLIDDKKLRDAYGTIIGKIAQSHWLYCEDLPQEFPTVLGALSIFPETWTVDPLKLACILRIADAMHIDDRRAPSILKAVREINRESELHWVFQEKLYKPRIENNRVVYTSKSAFGLSEIDAWWLCYDTLRMIDTELKNVDSLLLEQRRESFGVIGVYGIDSLEQIQKFITVDNWKPVDTCIRVNNVAKLVNTLGGVQLYGDNKWVPLRELIQNAADAIRARRCIDGESEDYGDIYLSWGEEDGREFVQIEDNGIGMSPNVMINVLLDFGQSFWSTPQMHIEFPGLEQKSFKSTGKFGIGFFSVFMWGENVKVISNRYDKARDNTMVLEFVNGVNSRPILRKANAEEVIKNGGTRIKIYLSKISVGEIFESNLRSMMDVEETLSKLCFSLDCNLYINNNSKKLLVRANDWLCMGTEEFLSRLLGKKCLEQLAKEKLDMYELLRNNIAIIKEEDGTVVGRACLLIIEEKRKIRNTIMGIVTIDGFETTALSGIIGVLKGSTEKASRDVAIPILSQTALDRWIEEQTKLIVSSDLTNERQIEIASFACALSPKITELKIARWKDTYVNYSQIVEIVRKQKFTQYYLVQDAAVDNWEHDEKKKLNMRDNVFVCAMGCPGILQTETVHAYITWPRFRRKNPRGFWCAVVEKQIVEAIAEASNSSVDSILDAMQFSDDDTKYNAVVGEADNNVEMRVDVDIVNLNNKEKK